MADTPTPPEPPRPRRRWTRILLVVSLALNLLVVGLVAGAVISGGPMDRDGKRRPVLGDLGFGPFVEALPRSDRLALGQAMQRKAGSFRENRAEIRRQFEALLTALRADPYDAEAVRALVVAQQANIGARQALGRDLLLERIEAMSAAERADYADALDRKLRRRGKPERH